MINNQELNDLQSGLNEISEFLLSKMKHDKEGFYWETISRDSKKGALSFTFNPSLWNGTGGIAWFFLVLFEHTKNEKHLDVAEAAFSKVYSYSTHQTLLNPSLYDGISGIIYLGLELFRVTGKELYLQQALNLYEMYRQKILAEQTEDMLIGISGILMMMASLYHYTKDQKLCDDIEALITTLLEKSLVAEAGIKWGNNLLSMDSLCGFSHGNSGIAFCLLQLGKYFDNKELIWLAEEAFRYEDLYYDPAQNNWMDLRWEESKNHLPSLFDWNKNTFLQEDFDLNAWAHGACGIGSARIRAFTITAEYVYKEDCRKVFERCKHDIKTRSKRNHILFSGYGGLSDFLLQYSEVFDNKEASELATEIVLEGLQKSRSHDHSEWGIQNSEDLGLMTGTAGIGLSLLAVIKGKSLNSILHPELPVSETGNNTILKNFKVKKAIFERFYPKTLEILKTFIPLNEPLYDSQTIEEFGNNLADIIGNLTEAEAIYVSDLHQWETVQIDIRKRQKGALCFQTRLTILKNEWSAFSENDPTELLKKRFVRNPFIDIYETRWNWKEDHNKGLEAGKYNNVFYSTDQEMFHLLVEPFPAAVIQLLENPLSIDELVECFQYSENEQEMMKKKLSEQIVELLKSFFIRIV
ncbi:lanthionine synthetase LanC family protein [Chryseobacterium sp. OSA05B]|uniref:lanthionine synthetase LanC family protein n=2 Tax=Pseudomonadati TaxID=3379134 RepID=UPI001CC0C923|nr:lanthionine synthetase LanC family protein [Chryseobacterium sp. OSA05B]